MARLALIGFLVVAVWSALVPGVAAAQDDQTSPPLASGWAEVLDGGLEMAGNPDMGYVVFGFDFGTGTVESFYSVDGESWDRIDVDTPTGDPWGVTDVGLGPAGFVAVSGMPGEHDIDERFFSFSPDGRNWERVDRDALPGGRFAHTVVTGSAGYMVEAAGPSECPSTGAIWFSADAQSWSQSQAPIERCGVAAITTTGSNWNLIAGGVNTVRIASSDDGLNWTELDTEQPPPSEPFIVEVELAVSGNTWMLMTSTVDIPGLSPGLWVSTDAGKNWSEPSIEIPAESPRGDYQPRSWTVTDNGIYGVGLIEDLTDNDQGYVLYSADGASWHQFILEGCCNDLAETPNGLLGVGTGGVYSWSPQLATTGSSNAVTLIALALVFLATGLGLRALGAWKQMRAEAPQ